MKVEIEIKKNGILPGSLGWFANLVEGASLEVVNQKTHNELRVKFSDGSSGVVARTMKEYDEKRIWWRNFNDSIVMAHPEDGYDKQGLFKVPLSSACAGKVRDFIRESTIKFKEVFEQD